MRIRSPRLRIRRSRRMPLCRRVRRGLGGCLCAATLFRLLGLFGHGAGSGAHVLDRFSAEFQFPVQVGKHNRSLATLAYDAGAVHIHPFYNPLQRGVLLYPAAAGKGNTRQDRAQETAGITVVALLTFTLFVAGVWHGAGPQFASTGCIGIYLSVNHAWQQYRRKPLSSKKPAHPLMQFATHRIFVLFTFLCLTVSIVFFRGDSLRLSFVLLGSMFGMHEPRAPLRSLIPIRVLRFRCYCWRRLPRG